MEYFFQAFSTKPLVHTNNLHSKDRPAAKFYILTNTSIKGFWDFSEFCGIPRIPVDSVA